MTELLIAFSWLLIGFLSGLFMIIYFFRGKEYNEEIYDDNIFNLSIATLLGYIVPIIALLLFLSTKLSPISAKLLYKLVNIGIKKSENNNEHK